MRADDEAVEAVDETWITRLSAGDREIGGSATVDATEFAHLFTVQTPQRYPIQQHQQIFKLLLRVFTRIDKTI